MVATKETARADSWVVRTVCVMASVMVFAMAATKDYANVPKRENLTKRANNRKKCEQERIKSKLERATNLVVGFA
jgi:hypothetical protein